MAILKLAAGLAVGYVLGSRAGREKYEQIAETARKVSVHPTVVQAQEQAKALISTGVDKVRPADSGSSSSSAPALETSTVETTTTVLDTTTEPPGPVATSKRKRSTTSTTPVTPATTTISSEPLV